MSYSPSTTVVPIEFLEIAKSARLEGNYYEAIKICEEILVEDLGCADAYEEIGENYLLLKEFNKAKLALKKCYSLNPKNPNVNYLLGFLYSVLQNWERSVEMLEKANTYIPHHPEILRCLGWSLYHNKRKTQGLGLAILERARQLAPKDILILCDLGLCYLTEKKLNESECRFKEAQILDPQNPKITECLNVIEELRQKIKGVLL